MENESENTAGEIFLSRLRTLVNASSDGKLRVTTAIGCLEIMKQELYAQFEEDNN